MSLLLLVDSALVNLKFMLTALHIASHKFPNNVIKKFFK